MLQSNNDLVRWADESIGWLHEIYSSSIFISNFITEMKFFECLITLSV